jgi:hypothetical protein
VLFQILIIPILCLEGILKSLLDSDVVDDIIDMKLEEIRQRPEGIFSMFYLTTSRLLGLFICGEIF